MVQPTANIEDQGSDASLLTGDGEKWNVEKLFLVIGYTCCFDWCCDCLL